MARPGAGESLTAALSAPDLSRISPNRALRALFAPFRAYWVSRAGQSVASRADASTHEIAAADSWRSAGMVIRYTRRETANRGAIAKYLEERT